MKRITVFMGSPRKKATYEAVKKLEGFVKSYGDVEFDYVLLKDVHLENCTGCKLCFDKGEE